MLVWGLVFIALTAVVWFLVKAQLQFRRFSTLPGPSPHFVLGNVSDFLIHGRFHRDRMVRENHDKYGSLFVLHLPLGSLSVLYCNDPDMSKQVLKDQETFPSRSPDGQAFSKFIPDGLLGDIKGPQWRFHRRILSPLFSSSYLRFYNNAVNEQLVKLQAYLATSRKDDQSEGRNVLPALTAFTLDVIGTVGFGTRFNALGDDDNAFVHAGKDILAAIIMSLFNPFYAISSRAIHAKALNGLRLFDDVVDTVLARPPASDQDKNVRLNMLQAMQKAVDPQTGRKLSRKEIRDEIHTLMGAGHETTSNTVAWVLHLLSTHPDIAQRVYDEVCQVHKKSDAALPLGLFYFDDIARLELTKRVFFETLRLYPTVPFFPRLAARDVVLRQESGREVLVPSGTMVMISAVSSCDIRDPSAFCPDRFDDSSPLYEASLSQRNKVKQFLPFGGGGRVCLGQRFAEMEAVQIIAAIVAKFHLAPVRGRVPLPYCDITLGPKETGLWLQLRER